MKSPLRDLRFKNLSIATLKKLIPTDATIESYGLFAGVTEIALAAGGRNITAFTNQPVIWEFWDIVSRNPERLHDLLTHKSFRFYGIGEFMVLQDRLHTFEGQDMRSALFFLLNRCSSDGRLSAGEFEPSLYNKLSLHYLKAFKKPPSLTIGSHTTTIEEQAHQPTAADYIMMPNLIFSYNLFEEGKNISYDSYSYQHSELKEQLRDEKSKIALVYNHHPALLKFYDEFNIRLIDKYGRPSANKQDYEEAIVTNF